MLVVWAEDSDADQVLIRSALDGVAETTPIRFVNDGADLLKEVARRQPKLVVLDVNMPNMGGIEALRKLREHPKTRELPVVMFSTARNSDEVATCEGLGVVDFVQKPMTYSDFVQAVRGIVARAA